MTTVHAGTEKTTERPDFVSDEHLEYLDELRESGVTNMYGAGPYVAKAFKELRKDDRAIKTVGYWMRTFSARHPK